MPPAWPGTFVWECVRSAGIPQFPISDRRAIGGIDRGDWQRERRAVLLRRGGGVRVSKFSLSSDVQQLAAAKGAAVSLNGFS